MRPIRVLQLVAALGAFVSALGFTGCSGCTINPVWDHYRGSTLRGGFQLFESVLNDPNRVSNLHPAWPTPSHAFHPTNALGFRASPIVYRGKVYIGNGNGYFYCVDANTGQQL